MKRLVIGMLAHVDSGKTTLSEAILYNAGALRKLGRVDHKDAHLDTDTIEKERGITIFSKQATFSMPCGEYTLWDTPGHVDFSGETERTLSILDYAVLVVSASDKVQSHTRTLWQLLSHYGVPTFIFVNKSDLENEGKDSILKDLKEKLSSSVCDFTLPESAFFEEAATNADFLLEEFVETGALTTGPLRRAVAERKVFPCFFGSALKNVGVDQFIKALDLYTEEKLYGDDFSAKVFKIAQDDKGARLTYVKITGGSLAVKNEISSSDKTEKVNELRIYSGAKYKSVPEAFPGQVVACLGLSAPSTGDGLGIEKSAGAPMLNPVFTYAVSINDSTDINKVLSAFSVLTTEDPLLSVSVSPKNGQINVHVMGKVQLEILKHVMETRFNIDISFESGSILYKETIKSAAYGVGHYEPLRHYAEVQLYLEPLPRGSGLKFSSSCSENQLARNWQRLILTHLAEKKHVGVLTGAPLTDVKITITGGRAHIKHTEGGDFRQATYRAVRCGLMRTESILLEPWYNFSLTVPSENIGRAMTDLDRMGASFDPVNSGETTSTLTGKVAISALGDYQETVLSYTKGQGRLSLTFHGYDEVKNAEPIIREACYDAEGDIENTPDSVFCSHGGGYQVSWKDIEEHMHVPFPDKKEAEDYAPSIRPSKTYTSSKSLYDDKELLEIFEKTYGKINHDPVKKSRTFEPVRHEQKSKSLPAKHKEDKETYLLIDGYNIIHADPVLSSMAKDSIDAARDLLIDKVSGYQAYTRKPVILVFDAYKVKGGVLSTEEVYGITVVYTKEAQTADAYIEKTSKLLSPKYNVQVATSDSAEQIIIFGHGAQRIPASEFLNELEYAKAELSKILSANSEGGAKSGLLMPDL